MSLNIQHLQKVRRFPDGSLQAQCPACHAAGGDTKGQHLWVFADGRFGCCVHPKDREHRKRIFALVGDRTRRTLTVRLRNYPQVIQNPAINTLSRDGGDQLGAQRQCVQTTRTGPSNSRAYRESTHMCKEAEPPVQPVRKTEPAAAGGTANPSHLPYIDADGVLIVPFGAPERYSWWADGQTAQETIEEVKQRMKAAEQGCDY